VDSLKEISVLFFFKVWRKKEVFVSGVNDLRGSLGTNWTLISTLASFRGAKEQILISSMFRALEQTRWLLEDNVLRLNLENFSVRRSYRNSCHLEQLRAILRCGLSRVVTLH